MITIFIALGAGFLVGGIAAIIDGWPYLLIERGFTEVIVGSVSVAAGIVLLALAAVLAELRRVRAALAHGTIAAALTSLGGEPPARLDREPELPPAPVPVAPPEAGGISVPAAAVAGALFGAGGVVAMRAADTGAPAKAASDDRAGQEDRTGQEEPFAPAQSAAQADEAEAWQASDTPAAPERPVEDDWFAKKTAAEPDFASLLKTIDDDGPRSEAPASEPEEPVAQPGDADDAAVSDAARQTHDIFAPWAAAPASAIDDREEPAVADAPADAEQPEEDRDADTRPVPGKPGDDLDGLREGLLGRGADVDDPVARIEPPMSASNPGEAHLDDAGAWMSGCRREPWFGTPVAEAPRDEDDEARLPAWPPQTREPAAFAAEDTASEPFAGLDTPADPPIAAPAEETPSGDALREPSASDAAEPLPAPEPEAPATSEEGIVGAYQVGGAHFTIYADGSIQARTAEGDYRFDSMEELKTYLASEKSRLGS